MRQKQTRPAPTPVGISEENIRISHECLPAEESIDEF
jgi:hypothetical protein